MDGSEEPPSFPVLKQLLITGALADWTSWSPSTRSHLRALRDSSGRSLLFYANTVDALHFLRQEGADLQLIDDYGQTALHTAVAADLLPVASRLIELCPSLLHVDDHAKRPPVLSAISVDMLRLLHGCSADVAAADDAGLTLLHLCARIEARVALVHYILQHSPNICPLDAAGRAPIHYACEHGHLAIVTALLASAPSSACLPDAALWTPLHFAALGAWPMHESHSEVTSLLLLSPVVDVNAREGQGLTPLHLCTDTPAARLLVKAGADIRVRDVSGRMPVHYASHENSIMLLQQGSPVDPRDNFGRTPCHTCTEGDKVDYLVVHGADINALDDEGKTPLDWAIEVDRLDVADVIERRGGRRGRTGAGQQSSSPAAGCAVQ